MTDRICGDDVAFDSASATYCGAFWAETTITDSTRHTKMHASYPRGRIELGHAGPPLHAGNSSR